MAQRRNIQIAEIKAIGLRKSSLSVSVCRGAKSNVILRFEFETKADNIYSYYIIYCRKLF